MSIKIQIKRGTSATFAPITLLAGEPAFVTDTKKLYIGDGTSKIMINNVDSVAGKTGAVTLISSDVGLGSVNNTADNTKNVLSASKLTTPTTINGVSFDGSAPITVADSTKVPTTTTVNGHALSGNVSVTASDVGLGLVANQTVATMFTNPTFTGNPTAPTPASNSDNTTSVATTAFVNNFVGAQPFLKNTDSIDGGTF